MILIEAHAAVRAKGSISVSVVCLMTLGTSLNGIYEVLIQL